MDTSVIDIDKHLQWAADIVGPGPFSVRIAAVAAAWEADKRAAGGPAAVLDFGRLRIAEAAAVVRDAQEAAERESR